MQRDEIGGFAEDGSPVIGRITSFTPGTMPEAHAHWRGQLAWCPDRPVTVETGGRLHLLSPGMAIWLPPTHRHRIRAEGARKSVSLYTRPAAAPLPKAPTPFPLEALEAELLRTLAGSSRADRQEPAFARLTAVLWDRLARPAPAPTLPLPTDPRLRRIAGTSRWGRPFARPLGRGTGAVAAQPATARPSRHRAELDHLDARPAVGTRNCPVDGRQERATCSPCCRLRHSERLRGRLSGRPWDHARSVAASDRELRSSHAPLRQQSQGEPDQDTAGDPVEEPRQARAVQGILKRHCRGSQRCKKISPIDACIPASRTLNGTTETPTGRNCGRKLI